MSQPENTIYFIKFFIKEKDFLNGILPRISAIKMDKLVIIWIIYLFFKIVSYFIKIWITVSKITYSSLLHYIICYIYEILSGCRMLHLIHILYINIDTIVIKKAVQHSKSQALPKNTFYTRALKWVKGGKTHTQKFLIFLFL